MTTQNRPFEKKTLPARQNPLTSRDNVKARNAEYSTARIRPDDLKYLKNYAFLNNMTIVDAVTKATDLLKSHDEDTYNAVNKLQIKE